MRRSAAPARFGAYTRCLHRRLFGLPLCRRGRPRAAERLVLREDVPAARTEPVITLPRELVRDVELVLAPRANQIDDVHPTDLLFQAYRRRARRCGEIYRATSRRSSVSWGTRRRLGEGRSLGSVASTV